MKPLNHLPIFVVTTHNFQMNAQTTKQHQWKKECY
jgi:hypothetical protein